MTQSKRNSMIESLSNTAVGFAVSMCASLIIFPVFGHAFTVSQNIGITLIFTVLSIVRGYVVRRVFNRWSTQ